MEPLRDTETVHRMREALTGFHPKYEVMLLLGIDTGLRISDILRLKGSNFNADNSFVVKEQKTGKMRYVSITDETGAYLKHYIRVLRLKPEDYLVYSRENRRDRPLTRSQAYRVISRVGDELSLAAIGTHTMRKTYALNKFREHGNLEELQQDFKHEKVSTTAMYLPKSDMVEYAKKILGLKD